MKVRAIVSFSGAVAMYQGEELDIPEGDILRDLLSAGYVEKALSPKKESGDEGKRNQ